MARLSDILMGFGTGALEEATEQRKQRRTSEADIAAKLLLLRVGESLRQQRPSEQTDAEILNVVRRLIPRSPTSAEARAAIPPVAFQASQHPEMVTVPGPEGGVVMGRGEVAPGQPSSEEVLRERLGRPAAQSRLEQDRKQAESFLNLLAKVGFGSLGQTRREGLEGTDPIVSVGTDADTGERVAITASGQVIPLTE